MAPFDLSAFRAQQQAKNTRLLINLAVSLPAAPSIPADSPAPVKKAAPAAPKRPPPLVPTAPLGAKEEVAAREARGLRSSGRIRDSVLGLTPKKAEPKFYSGPDLDAAGDREGANGSRSGKIGKRRYDPKRIGAIPGIEINRVCMYRDEWSTLAVHAPTVAGIATGKVVQGAPVVASICTGGGNYGDADRGETLTYSGSGGRKLTERNLRTAPQTSNMTWDENPRNAALLHSVKTRTPIRVLRSYKASGPYAPPHGYIYSGLYVAVKSWVDKNEDGLDVCRIALVRMPGQPPLAIHPDRKHMVDDVGADVTVEPALPRDRTSSSPLSSPVSASSAKALSATPEPTTRKRSAGAAADGDEPVPQRRRSMRGGK
ncbi:hypothetical protein JCM9279_006011 [Rhodotorula babjevae]